MSEETVLGLPIRQNWWYQFFCSLHSHIICTPYFSSGGATLGWNQLLCL